MSEVLELPIRTREFLAKTKRILINGQWVSSVSGKVYDSINPATSEVIAKIYEGSKEDVDLAVHAAKTAFENSWSKVTPEERSKLLNKLADLIEERAEEIAYLETLDFGCTISQSRDAWIPGAVSHLRYYAGWCTKLTGETLQLITGGNYHVFTKREPLGVCGLITSWNFPLQGACRKLAPALAAGNTVVLKPSEETSLTTLLLGELIQEAGFPDGVVNIVTGPGETTGAAISNHPDINKISFTGSTVVGKSIIRSSSDTIKKLTLELGGKSPNIIFADADIDKAVQGAFMAIFTNQGEVCSAGSRVYVQKEVFNEVTKKLVELARNMKVGDPFDPTTEMGPLVSKKHLERVNNYIKVAKNDGAKVLIGGTVLTKGEFAKGNFLEPTILINLDENCRAVKEEIFGPVLCIMPFTDIDEVIERANLTQYGLAAGVWTKDMTKAHKIISTLNAGTVWVNCYLKKDTAVPTTGFKQSGLGYELGYPGIEAYTKLKGVVMNFE
ncbi:aldehyde dehydrogenase family protein [Neobacillus niacini]|uniref:aldehyde dehydrogenase family protein n=1 Tax=Neobacillus niacini TaxID=86668 RepID=UPI0007AB63E5|nr:aldehyde dehydrogenase family protein [Neobacillus niacini]MEC1525008.1 aldehyde dehydrogenase family protein [Neobacillus niacini]